MNRKKRPVDPDYLLYTQKIHGTGIFACIWYKFMVHVGRYFLHGAYMGCTTHLYQVYNKSL